MKLYRLFTNGGVDVARLFVEDTIAPGEILTLVTTDRPNPQALTTISRPGIYRVTGAAQRLIIPGSYTGVFKLIVTRLDNGPGPFRTDQKLLDFAATWEHEPPLDFTLGTA